MENQPNANERFGYSYQSPQPLRGFSTLPPEEYYNQPSSYSSPQQVIERKNPILLIISVALLAALLGGAFVWYFDKIKMETSNAKSESKEEMEEKNSSTTNEIQEKTKVVSSPDPIKIENEKKITTTIIPSTTKSIRSRATIQRDYTDSEPYSRRAYDTKVIRNYEVEGDRILNQRSIVTVVKRTIVDPQQLEAQLNKWTRARELLVSAQGRDEQGSIDPNVLGITVTGRTISEQIQTCDAIISAIRSKYNGSSSSGLYRSSTYTPSPDIY